MGVYTSNSVGSSDSIARVSLVDTGSEPEYRSHVRGHLKDKIASLLKFDLVLIDELGYLPVNRKSAHNLFQFINALYEYRSIILTTNKHFTEWADFFVDEAVAVPVVDRIIHHSHIFVLGGDSYRLKQKSKLP